MRIADDCTRCLARNDGMDGTYCFHCVFAESFPGEGRPLPDYPRTPKWCPGMVRRPSLSADASLSPRAGREAGGGGA